MVNEMEGLDLHCSQSETLHIPIEQLATLGEDVTQSYCPITSGEEYLKVFNIEESDLLRNSLVMLGIYFAMILMSAFLLKFVKHQKR